MASNDRVTSSDVASAAGVSRATVSYVLNHDSGDAVTPATRRRVLQAADELGYSPSMSARALRGKRELVLALLPDWPIGSSSSRFLTALDEVFSEAGLTFLIRYADPDRFSPERLWRAMSPAAVVSFIEIDPATIVRARQEGVTVTMAGFDRLKDEFHVDAPEQATGRLQVSHLAERGRQRLAVAMPDDPRLDAFARPRLEGVTEECASRGLSAPLRVTLNLSPAQARDLVTDLVSRDIDGVCCYNDQIAMAVLAGARLAGVQVPAQIAVIGVDDEPMAALTSPPLTTVSLDVAQVARRIADSVRAAMKGQPPPPLPPTHNIATLIVREST